jgi:hypothetical protein
MIEPLQHLCLQDLEPLKSLKQLRAFKLENMCDFGKRKNSGILDYVNSWPKVEYIHLESSDREPSETAFWAKDTYKHVRDILDSRKIKYNHGKQSMRRRHQLETTYFGS